MFRSYTSDDKAAEGSGARRLKLLATFSVLAVIMVMVSAVGLFSACDDSDAIDTDDASGVTVNGVHYDSISAALSAIDSGTIKLEGNISDSFGIATGEDIILDLNGKTCTVSTYVVIKGKLTLIDSTADAEPKYINGEILYESGVIECKNGLVLSAEKGGLLEIRNGTVRSNSNAVWAEGNLNSGATEPYCSKVVMNGGFVEAQECSIVVVGIGAEVVVNGGICYSKDNSVLSGNGSHTSSQFILKHYLKPDKDASTSCARPRL